MMASPTKTDQTRDELSVTEAILLMEADTGKNDVALVVEAVVEMQVVVSVQDMENMERFWVHTVLIHEVIQKKVKVSMLLILLINGYPNG